MDYLEGCRKSHFVAGKPLQYPAFEGAAAGGPVFVNPAALTVKAGARLGKGEFATLWLESQSEPGQTLGIIEALQFDVREKHAVAAQATSGT